MKPLKDYIQLYKMYRKKRVTGRYTIYASLRYTIDRIKRDLKY